MKDQIKSHQNYMLNLIHTIIIETGTMSLDQLDKNEQLKERLFAQLQQVGQAAEEVRQLSAAEDILDTQLYEKLALLRTARYHQEAELNSHRSLWSIVKHDLPNFEAEIKQDLVELS